MGLMSNKIEREKLRPGDHIYTWRSGYSYSHHGIYVGDGKVIHLTRGSGFIIFSSSSESQPSNDRVVCYNIEDFLGDGQLCRFEYGVNKIVFLIKRPGTCSPGLSNPTEQVLHRAFYLLEHENGFGNYNLFHKNCEDFAAYCKTGIVQLQDAPIGRSAQIASLFSALGALIIMPFRFLPSNNFICLALSVCFLYCYIRLFYYIGSESLYDVVEVEKLQDYLSNEHNNWEKTMKKDQKSTTKWWTLPRPRYYAYTFWAIRIWYWTPQSTFLLWLKTVLIYILLSIFVSDHLKLNGFKLGEYSAYTLWLLVYFYWRWTSENTILLWTRLFVFDIFLTTFISDHPRGFKLHTYFTNTIGVLVLWYWNSAGSTIRQWTIALVYIFLFDFVLKNIRHLIIRAFYACFIIQLAVLFWDWITYYCFSIVGMSSV